MVFFFNDTATTEIYTLSLHDALPIYPARARRAHRRAGGRPAGRGVLPRRPAGGLPAERAAVRHRDGGDLDRKSTRLNSSHANISYAVFCLQKKQAAIRRTAHARPL